MSEDIRQSVLIAGTLIDQYGDVVRRLLRARAEGEDPDESVLRAELERIYAAIWEHLDGAAARSRTMGRDVRAYEQIRATPGLDTAVAVEEISDRVTDIQEKPKFTRVISEARVVHNKGGVELAQRGAAALRSAWPELDWTVAEAPAVDLRPASSKIVGALAKLFGRKNRKIIG